MKQDQMEQSRRAAKSESCDLKERLEEEQESKTQGVEEISNLETELKDPKEILSSTLQGDSQAGKFKQQATELSDEGRELQMETGPVRKVAAKKANDLHKSLKMPSKKRKRLDKDQARIVIVGCGLAGLSAAISLERAGFSNITLYERDETFECQREGYGLTLTYNPKGPLASLGVLEKVAEQDCPSRSHYMFHTDGSIMGYYGNAFDQNRGWGQRGNLRVPRKVLRRILIESLNNTTIHWGHHLARWECQTDQHLLSFETKSETVMVKADLLVAADGVRSAILQDLDQRFQEQANHRVADKAMKEGGTGLGMGLRDMGIRLILGIANFSHPLLNERGFYTLDGKHRLFTMPYQSNRFDPGAENRVMWQLSFATTGGTSQTPLDSTSLRDFVLENCKDWHEPVLGMVNNTPLSSIWGTDLMDRDPEQILKTVKLLDSRRLAVVGDALHSMSPFKGQGANQALADGPHLASWLEKASIDSALTGFWREVVKRTAPVVAASRTAARELHSQKGLQQNSVAGVRPDEVPNLLTLLKDMGLGAGLGVELDRQVARVIDDHQWHAPKMIKMAQAEQQEEALEFAKAGNTQGLRQLSLSKHSESIRTARDQNRRTCLHLAAMGGHAFTCRWLLTELGLDVASEDELGNSPRDYASAGGHQGIIAVFDAVIS